MSRRRGRPAKIASDFQTVWDSASGRRVLAHLMERAGMLAPLQGQTPDGHMVDLDNPTALAIAEGQRRMGVYIAQMIAADLNPSFVRDVQQGAQEIMGIFEETNLQ